MILALFISGCTNKPSNLINNSESNTEDYQYVASAQEQQEQNSNSKPMPSINLISDKKIIYVVLNAEIPLTIAFEDYSFNGSESPKKVAIFTELFGDYDIKYNGINNNTILNFNDNFEIIDFNDDWIKEEPSFENSGPEDNFGDYPLHVNLLQEYDNFVFITKEIPDKDTINLKLTLNPKSKGRFGLLFTGYNINTEKHQLASDGLRICVGDTIEEAKEICSKELVSNQTTTTMPVSV